MKAAIANVPKQQKPTPAGDEGVFDTLSNRTFTVRFLAGLCFFLFLAAVIGPMATIYFLREPQVAVVPWEDGSVTIARVQRFTDAFAFHKLTANEASKAILMRGPEGLDDLDTVALMFNEKARTKLDTFTKGQEPTFREYGYHQKAEIATTEIAADPDGSFRARVRGQLIRTGSFNNTLKVDRLKFELILYMFRNEQAAYNKKYPLGVWDFDYSESR